MNNYATAKDFNRMPLAQVEKTLSEYLAIAERSDWNVSGAFIKDLEMLTAIAKAKGSAIKW